MKLFEYCCTKCGEHKDFLIKDMSNFVEPPLHFSDMCNGEDMYRVITSIAFKQDKKNNLQSNLDELRYSLSETKSDFLKSAKNK